ncbi:MAG: isochorismatase family protein, partial [Lentisphaeraceae bacterium]|nr:isochorismatase family protein [Lentisphaeraceae bacterium]
MSIPRIQSYPMPQEESFPKNKMDWEIDPSRCLMLIHDTQDYFIDFYDRSQAPIPEMVSNILKLREACYKLEIPVAYTAQLASQTLEERGILQPFWGPGIMGKNDVEGIISDLKPGQDDIIVDKWRYSAFKKNNFAELFKKFNRDQLIICGVYGHIGCLSTANEAFMNDIESFFIGDAIADFSLEDHLMSVKYITKCCGVAKSTQQAIKELSKSKSRSISLDMLHSDVAEILQVDKSEIYTDDNLMYAGLDSIRFMALFEKWKTIDDSVSFAQLA